MRFMMHYFRPGKCARVVVTVPGTHEKEYKVRHVRFENVTCQTVYKPTGNDVDKPTMVIEGEAETARQVGHTLILSNG